MGWVSLFEPESLRDLLHMPAGSRPVAVLCLGYVPEFYPRPMLETAEWARRCALRRVVHTDYWSEEIAAEHRDETNRDALLTTQIN